MTNFDLLIDLHQNNPRQGPGSDGMTQKALSFIDLADQPNLQIADIGCGTGAQTMALAQHTKGHITAVDLFPIFLEKLNERAQEKGLSDRITTLARSMEDLPFEGEALDIIWSEGAIYIMGFEKGVRDWKRFLKPGGYLAVSEISWLTSSRPAELEDYWNKEYPEIGTVSEKIRVLEANGYTPVAHFILPPECWIDYYYQPIRQGIPAFLERHAHSEAARQLVEGEQEEMAFYEKYQPYYSYGFYIARKFEG
jgi:ubiquinone/menaquinone biosynthesis C-methylase UbiE